MKRIGIILRLLGLTACLAAVLWLVFGPGRMTEETCVTRAEAAKELALLKGMPEPAAASRFPEAEQENWYVKYADFLYEEGMWTEIETPASAETLEGDYTYAEVWGLLDRLGLSSSQTDREKDRKQWDRAVPRTVWNRIWDEVREHLDPEEAVHEETWILYGTPENLENQEAWTAATSRGNFHFEGLNLNGYQDRELKVWVRETEILRVEAVTNRTVTYENVLILELKPEENGCSLRFFCDGVEKTCRMEAVGLEKEYRQVVGDIVMEDGRVTQVDVKPESITGKVLAVTEETIEIEGYGAVPRADHLQIYRTYGEPAMQGEDEIRLGNEVQRFFVAEGKICGILTERAFEATHIRVLLKTTGFASVYHEKVEVTCEKAFRVSYGDRTDYYQPGQILAVAAGDACLEAGRMQVTPEEGGKLEVLTLERECGTPAYEGTLELVSAGEGIVMINEVLLESYLEEVLPSEMPESYGLEALKAQAVCARSYAYRQMEGNAYREFGANVDDSSSFQVYHNASFSKLAEQAVEETCGQVLTYGGSVITAYYFSTSCGHTTDAAVWGADAAQYPYLEGKWMQTEPGEGDLTEEKTFEQFIRQSDERAYEAGFPWYRWKVSVSVEELGDRIQAYLAKNGGTPSDTLLVRQEDGAFAPGTITGIGELREVKVAKRGIGGIAEELEVTGTAGTVRILRQNAIRTALCSPEYCYERNGDTVQNGRALLPSAYVYPEPQYEGETLTGYILYGGGSGHGVGMSQNAACYLARIGKKYEEILDFFYPGTVLARLY